ncbi:MAG TPA: hypothetical protein DCL38_06570 [Lachnospiraceae bacterium]|nr:hypothetical protein [Lachnospiraceae bacterium]
MEAGAVYGKDVIWTLAETYNQLYLRPGEEGEAEYREVVLRGEEPLKRSLSHFITDDRDRMSFEETPAGSVRVITLYNRRDFETFLQIMAERCKRTEIPASQGASYLGGVINWRRIEAHEREFYRKELEKGNTEPDWDSEFERFTSDGNNFKDALIILSVGPYSGVSADRAGLPYEEWIERSDVIRRYHECTHFICRRLFPEDKDPVWDEVVADCTGVYAAFGRLLPEMVELFLGIGTKDGRPCYTGGRLENYLDGIKEGAWPGAVNSDAGEMPAQERLDLLSVRIHEILKEFEVISGEEPGVPVYELMLKLEKQHGNMIKGNRMNY